MLSFQMLAAEDDVVRWALLMQLRGPSTITQELAARALSGAFGRSGTAGTAPAADSAAKAASAEQSSGTKAAQPAEAGRDMLRATLSFLSRISADNLADVMAPAALQNAFGRGTHEQTPVAQVACPPEAEPSEQVSAQATDPPRLTTPTGEPASQSDDAHGMASPAGAGSASAVDGAAHADASPASAGRVSLSAAETPLQRRASAKAAKAGSMFWQRLRSGKSTRSAGISTELRPAGPSVAGSRDLQSAELQPPALAELSPGQRSVDDDGTAHEEPIEPPSLLGALDQGDNGVENDDTEPARQSCHAKRVTAVSNPEHSANAAHHAMAAAFSASLSEPLHVTAGQAEAPNEVALHEPAAAAASAPIVAQERKLGCEQDTTPSDDAQPMSSEAPAAQQRSRWLSTAPITSRIGSLWERVRARVGQLNDSYAPTYHPFGLQLYLNVEGISVGLHPEQRGKRQRSKRASPKRAASAALRGSKAPSQHLGNDTPPEASAATSAAELQRMSEQLHKHEEADEALPGEFGTDIEGEVADLLTRGNSGDYATAEGASAAAAAVAAPAAPAAAASASPGKQPAFHWHRMYSYRLRFMHLVTTMGAFDALVGHESGGKESSRPQSPRMPDSGAGAAEAPADLATAAAVVPPINAAGLLQLIAVQLPTLPLSRAAKRAQGQQASQTAQSGNAGNQKRNRKSADSVAALAHVRGEGLQFAGSAKVLLPLQHAQVDASLQLLDTASDKRTVSAQVHAALPAAAVRAAALQVEANAAVELCSDFEAAQVPVALRVPQCAICGAGSDVVLRVLDMLRMAESKKERRYAQKAVKQQQKAVAKQQRIEWRTAVRLLKRQQRQQKRSGEDAGASPPPLPSADSFASMSSFISNVPDVSPVVACGAVRYVDAAWDPETGHESDAHTCRHLANLAEALLAASGRVASGGSRLGALHRRSWSMLTENLTLMRDRATLQLTKGLTNMHSAVAGRFVSTGASSAPPATMPTADDCDVPSTRSASASLARDSADAADVPAAAQTLSPEPSPSGRGARQGRRRRGKKGAQESPPPMSPGRSALLPAAFLYPESFALRDAGVPQAARRHVCVDVLLIAEDLTLWRDAARADGGQACSESMQMRRDAVERVATAAMQAGVRVVLAACTPENGDDGGILEWLHEVAAVKAAYGISGNNRCTVVPIALKDTGVSAVAVHNAVALASEAQSAGVQGVRAGEAAQADEGSDSHASKL